MGVPGTVAGLALAQRRYGRLSWRQVVEPALAQSLQNAAQSLQNAAQTPLGRFAESRRVFLRNGRPFHAGEVLRQPDLASILGRLEKYGPRDFYTGRTAQLITRDMAAHGGLVTPVDLRRYRAVERKLLVSTY